MSLDVTIEAYQPVYLPRMLAMTAEGFQGVSIDHLIEERLGVVAPGWEERKLSDIRRAVANEPEGVFVAVHNGEAIGFVTVNLIRDKRMGRIADLVVDARFRRQGIASRLIEKGLAYMREQGMALAKIETLANNTAGQAAYPKLGFVEIVRQVHYAMRLDQE